MRSCRFTEEWIIGVLNEGEAKTQIEELCRLPGISPTTYDRWRRKYGGLEVDEAGRLKQLKNENRRSKWIV